MYMQLAGAPRRADVYERIMSLLEFGRPLLVVIEGDWGAETPEDGPDVDGMWLADTFQAEQVLQAIGDYQSQYPWCPSNREVMACTSIRSTSHLQYWIRQLAARGFLAWGERSARQLALTDRGWWAYDELEVA